jgi:hypothetical protein
MLCYVMLLAKCRQQVAHGVGGRREPVVMWCYVTLAHSASKTTNSWYIPCFHSQHVTENKHVIRYVMLCYVMLRYVALLRSASQTRWQPEASRGGKAQAVTLQVLRECYKSVTKVLPCSDQLLKRRDGQRQVGRQGSVGFDKVLMPEVKLFCYCVVMSCNVMLCQWQVGRQGGVGFDNVLMPMVMLRNVVLSNVMLCHDSGRSGGRAA